MRAFGAGVVSVWIAASLVGCCVGEKKFDWKWETGEPAGEPAGKSPTGKPAASFDEALGAFVAALESKNPGDFEPLIADNVLAGEPYSEGEYLTRDDFLKTLSKGDSPYARALYSDARVSSFTSGYRTGALEKAEWGAGGYSVATADMFWFVAFEPGPDGNWYLKVCAVSTVGN